MLKSRSLFPAILFSALLIPLLVLGLYAFEPPDTAVTGSDLDAAHLLGSEVQLSNPSDPEAEMYTPDIANNGRHRDYLIVWMYDVHGNGSK